MTTPMTRAAAKAEAKDLRTRLAKAGTQITHGEALNRVARAAGFGDWNALSANLPDDALPVAGDRVTGRYLGQAFTARVVSANPARAGWTRIALHLDEPVDVVTFEGFSALRQRVTGTIGPKRHTAETTSDGQPHIVLDP